MRMRRPYKFPRLTRLPLAFEIALAVLLKIVILAALWKAFFAAPQTKKMALPAPQVVQHLLADENAAGTAGYPSSSLPKVPDDSNR